MTLRQMCAIAVGVCVLLAAGNAQAVSYSTFFGEDMAGGSLPVPNSAAAETAFLSNLSSTVGTEDFESLATGTIAPLTVDFGYAQATLTGGGAIQSGYSVGRFAISGSKYWETNENFQITFSTQQAAFGFYGTDIGDFSGQLKLTLAGGGSVTMNVPHTVGGPNGTCLYFGMIADDAASQFTSVSFSTTSGSDWFGFDDMTIGTLGQVVTIIPEPLTMLGVFGAVAGVGGYIRRRRRA